MTTIKGSEKSSQNRIIFDFQFWFFVTLFSILIGIICFLPYWLTKPSFAERLNFTNTGSIGDTISGTMSPFIAIAAALLTFIAFWVQYKANKHQTEQFELQAKDVSIERFESKFFELLKMHRENLDEIEIKEYKKGGVTIRGRKVFISMFFELKFCFATVQKFVESYDNTKLGFSKDNDSRILEIAYHLFFMGVGDNSDKLVSESLKKICDQIFLAELLSFIDKKIKTEYINFPGKAFNYKIINDSKRYSFKPKYLPFGGHLSRLGHYYRHLYQTVKFISEQNPSIMNEDKKCEYAKIVRAQLSDYEQLILFYNVLSSLGKAWTDENGNFIKRFRMIKNMPVPLADFAVRPRDKFKAEIQYWQRNGKSFFEWDERS